MVKRNLKGNRINVFHTLSREPDAQKIAERLASLKALVKLIEVPDDRLSQAHFGNLYYFREAKKYSQVAAKLSDVLSEVESVNIRFYHADKSLKDLYSIWIGRGSEESESAKASTHRESCLIRGVNVRRDGLQDHMGRVHFYSRKGTLEPKAITTKKPETRTVRLSKTER